MRKNHCFNTFLSILFSGRQPDHLTIMSDPENSTMTATTNNGPPSASVAEPGSGDANTNGDIISGSENVRLFICILGLKRGPNK